MCLRITVFSYRITPRNFIFQFFKVMMYLYIILSTLLLLVFFPSSIKAATETGYLFGLPDKQCSGINIASSQYCSGFAPYFLASTDIVPGLLYLLNFREDDEAAAAPFRQANYDKLNSVSDFDKVFRDTILPNAGVIMNRPTSCKYRNYGIQGFITYACQWLLNYGVIYPSPQNWYQTTCVSKTGVGSYRGLCLATVSDFVSSARSNFDKDPSCSSSGKNEMLQRTESYFETSKRVSNRNDTSSSCISWQMNESNLNLCGYITTTQACLNGCKLTNVDCTQLLNNYVMITNSSDSMSTTAKVLIALMILSSLGAGLSAFYFFRIKKMSMSDILSKVKSVLPMSKFSKSKSTKSSETIAPYHLPDSNGTDTLSRPMNPNPFDLSSGVVDASSRDELFGKSSSPSSSTKDGFSSATKITLPSLDSSLDLFPTSDSSSSSSGTSLFNKSGTLGTTSNGLTTTLPKSSSLSQPPLTMQEDDNEDDDSMDSPVGLLMSRPLPTTPSMMAASLTSMNPMHSKEADPSSLRSSISDTPLPRQLPSTIGAPSTSISVLPVSTSALAPTSTKELNSRGSRTQSLMSNRSMDSIMFRRETLLQANSISSTMVKVKYEFKPARNDEIELVPGDQVIVITRYEDGWGWGCKVDDQGKEVVGAFPLNCLEDFYE